MNHASTKLIPTDDERQALFRALCAWTNDPTIAEDLVQQTMLEAWKSNRQPEPSEWRPWLFGIARNVLLRWRRELCADMRQSIALPESDSILLAASQDGDIDAELDQQGIVNLLHEMLGKLPPETRQVLLLKYIHELPQSEIAAALNLKEKALEGRLHRGKQKLRTQILIYRPDTALSYGIVAEPNTWQATNIWCPTCGRQHMLARWTDNGTIRITCPNCEHRSKRARYVGGLFRSREPNRRPSFRQIMDYFQTQTHACLTTHELQTPACPACSQPLDRNTYQAEPTSGSALTAPAFFDCQTCGSELKFENLFICGIDSAPGRTFLATHAKVRFLPLSAAVYQGRPAVLARWTAVDYPAEFSAWHDPASGYLIDTHVSST